jgi:hypothetical protein
VRLVEIDVVGLEPPQRVLDASMMCWRERPVSFGPGPIGPMTLVAMSTAWRFLRAVIHLPRTVSDSPPLFREPSGIDVGGVDEVAAGLEIGVETASDAC